MKTIQETFDLVIKNKIYPENPNDCWNTSNFMCCALYIAYERRLITRMEYDKACNAINRYLGATETLRSALEKSGYGKDTKYKFCKEIYQCWAGRPPLKRTRKSKN